MPQHSYEYLVARTVRARQIPELVEIARNVNSATSAYNQADKLLRDMGRRSPNLARQTRFLYIILRDYGSEKFEQSLEHQG